MTTTKKKWADRVRAWQSSGLSSEEFCQGQGFTAGGLRHWAYRLRKDAASRNAAKAGGVAAPQVRLARVVPASPVLSAARLAPQGGPSAAPGDVGSGLTLEVGPVRISVGRDFDRPTLASVLALLGAQGGQR